MGPCSALNEILVNFGLRSKNTTYIYSFAHFICAIIFCRDTECRGSNACAIHIFYESLSEKIKSQYYFDTEKIMEQNTGHRVSLECQAVHIQRCRTAGSSRGWALLGGFTGIPLVVASLSALYNVMLLTITGSTHWAIAVNRWFEGK